MSKRILRLHIATYLFLLVLLHDCSTVNASSDTTYPIHDIITGIIDWKTDFLGSDYILKSSTFLENAGVPSYNEYALSLARLGTDRGYDSYLSLLYNNVSSLYAKKSGTELLTPVDWQKTSLTILALGGNPAHMTNTVNETTINLLADYCYNYVSPLPAKEMDTATLSYMLITMDALDYSISESSVFTRKSLLLQLLSRQRNDGSFSSKDHPSDSALTALVIQALAPYYNDETIYDTTDSRSAGEAIEDALDFLSSKQTKNGDIKNGSTPCLESTAQTLSACASLGIDPYTDQRFILNAHNLLDGLMRYQNSDGGFTDQLIDGTSSASNDTSSLLALNSLISLYRYRHHQRDFFDMRAEFSDTTRQTILDLEEGIAALTETSSKKEIIALHQAYLSLTASEKRYVYHYKTLSKAIDAHNLSKDTSSFVIRYNRLISDNGTLYNIIQNEELMITKHFTGDDYYRYTDLPERLTSNHYNVITELYCKLLNTDPNTFSLSRDKTMTYDLLLKNLKAQKTALETTIAKIESINHEIQTTLSSFSNITKEDKELIDRLVYQASTIAPADQKKIHSYNELLHAQEQLSPQNSIDNIKYLLALLSVLLFLPFFLHSLHKFKEKKKECPPKGRD